MSLPDLLDVLTSHASVTLACTGVILAYLRRTTGWKALNDERERRQEATREHLRQLVDIQRDSRATSDKLVEDFRGELDRLHAEQEVLRIKQQEIEDAREAVADVVDDPYRGGCEPRDVMTTRPKGSR